jgi:hypothetical protein
MWGFRKLALFYGFASSTGRETPKPRSCRSTGSYSRHGDRLYRLDPPRDCFARSYLNHRCPRNQRACDRRVRVLSLGNCGRIDAYRGFSNGAQEVETVYTKLSDTAVSPQMEF